MKYYGHLHYYEFKGHSSKLYNNVIILSSDLPIIVDLMLNLYNWNLQVNSITYAFNL